MKNKKNCHQAGNKLAEISCLVRQIVYVLVYKKQGRSKTNLLNSLKWRSAETARNIIRLLHIIVAT